MNEEFVEIPFVVEPNYGGWRLDLYLCEKMGRLSRSKAQKLIRTSLVCDRKLKASTAVRPGMCFALRRPVREEPEVPTCVPELYRDDWLLVLDKPAGLPIHPTARYHKSTLVWLLKERCGDGSRADPVHRLDRETSGLLVCGRSLEACQSLMRAFMAGEVHKEYLAICEGHPPQDEFEVDAPIAEGTPLIRIAVRIDKASGRPARTRFTVLQRFQRRGEPFSMIRAFPETGRQHQIRIHLREAGFPIVGDKMYGPDAGYFDRFSKRTLEPEAWLRLRLERHALHAARIHFRHPGKNEDVAFESPLPEDLKAFCEGGL